MSTTYDTGAQFINVDGQIVEKDALAIAERLKEYDPNLEILCLDPMKSGLNEAPFVICGIRPDTGALYKIFEAWELNETILERIYHSDQHRFDAISRVESMEAMQKRLRENRYQDKAAENMEIVAAAVRNTKSSFTFKNDQDELVTIHDNKPPEKGHGRIYNY